MDGSQAVALLVWLALGLGGFSAIVMVALALNRLQLDYQERRLQRLERRLKPLALAIEAGDDVDTEYGRLSAREAQVLAELAIRYAAALRGESVIEVTEFFERHGYVEREVARLNSRRAWRRAAAAYTLGGMGSVLAAPALIPALADRSAAVRMAAARSLGRVQAPEAAAALAAAFASGSIPYIVAAEALLALGESARTELAHLLDHDSPDARALAVEVLSRVGSVDDSELIATKLTDTAAAVRSAAARALARVGDERATAALRRSLGDRVPSVRAAAAAALGAIRDLDSLDALHQMARYDSYQPASAAAQALGKIDPLMSWRLATVQGGNAHLREAATRLRLAGAISR